MVANKHFLSLSVLIVLLGLSSNLAAGQVLFQGFNWESWKENGGWYNLLMGKLGGRHRRRRHHPRLAPSAVPLCRRARSGALSIPSIDATEPSFAVAEIWTSMANGGDGKPNYDQNAHRQELVNWVDRVGGANSNATAFDFTTKGILNVAVEGELWRLRGEDGKAPGMIGWWPAKATTFVDNHDTGSTQHLWPFPSDKDMPTSSPTPATHASSTTISSTGVSRMRSSASCQSETGRGSTRRGGAVAGSCRVEKGRCCQRWKPREGNLRMCPWPGVFRASLFTQ
uniref:1,4-alpha-D-glucan glucanohydrolase n=1 Tax=Oryza nivara TaxID=4536 RepID=A0A0E0FLI2_ORYNI